MRLKVSFCNKTVLRTDITRYAPLWGGYTMMLALLTLMCIRAPEENPAYAQRRELRQQPLHHTGTRRSQHKIDPRFQARRLMANPHPDHRTALTRIPRLDFHDFRRPNRTVYDARLQPLPNLAVQHVQNMLRPHTAKSGDVVADFTRFEQDAIHVD